MHLAKFLPLSAPRPRGGNASSFRLDFEPPGLHARDARGSAAAVPPPGGGIGRAQAPQPREGGGGGRGPRRLGRRGPTPADSRHFVPGFSVGKCSASGALE